MNEPCKNKINYFSTGLYLALLQFSYYFLVEAFLSSRSISYFIALFFWLAGFLIGLNLKNRNLFFPLAALSLSAYYVSFFLLQWMPFENILFYTIGLLIALSSIFAGYFFSWTAEVQSEIKNLLFHENNGFILGALISLIAADFSGKNYLMFAPLVGGILVFVTKTIFIKNLENI